jgi:hypothetical protein
LVETTTDLAQLADHCPSITATFHPGPDRACYEELFNRYMKPFVAFRSAKSAPLSRSERLQ